MKKVQSGFKGKIIVLLFLGVLFVIALTYFLVSSYQNDDFSNPNKTIFNFLVIVPLVFVSAFVFNKIEKSSISFMKRNKTTSK